MQAEERWGWHRGLRRLVEGWACGLRLKIEGAEDGLGRLLG